MRKPLTVLFSAALALAMLPASAFAAPVAQPDADAPFATQAGENVASGTWGTCPWEISADGVLTVHPGTGADTNGPSPWAEQAEEITKAVFKAENGNKVIAPADCSYLFWGCHSLTSIDLSGFDTANVTNMYAMFGHCPSLASLDLSSFDTRNVTNMGDMFRTCRSLTSVDLSSFDTGNVTDMHNMFLVCESLTSLDLSSFDTRNVAGMFAMFSGCSSLVSLDLSSFDTSNMNVMEMDNALYGCASLSSVKVGFKTLAKIELPAETVNGHSDWYSKAAGAWFTSEQISAQRKGIADTYLKEESANDEPGQPDQPGTADPKPDDGDEPGTADPEPVATQAMYRLYNPNSGEHFYTASTVERDSVIAAGWNDEGIGWTAPTRGIQVYRLYNSFAGEHHYTTSPEERDMLVSVGWTWEEGGWFSDVDESVPLYRAYNPNAFANNHHYTTDWGEFQTLLGLGWQDEGVGWHGVE